MTLLILYLLASLDGLLCGSRAAMGRCPLIHLRPYYVVALLRGFFAAQVASLIAIIALALVLLSVEIILNRLSSRRQSAEICSLV